MAGFETVVRPAVLPSIRPAPTRSLPPADDPTKGFCVIKGSSGKVVDLSMSWNVSTSKTRLIEAERRVDEVRVYQMNDDGTVNKKNFIDIERTNKMKMANPALPAPAVVSTAGTIAQGKAEQEAYDNWFFTKLRDEEVARARNQEILRRNVIKQNEEYQIPPGGEGGG